MVMVMYRTSGRRFGAGQENRLRRSGNDRFDVGGVFTPTPNFAGQTMIMPDFDNLMASSCIVQSYSQSWPQDSGQSDKWINAPFFGIVDAVEGAKNDQKTSP